MKKWMFCLGVLIAGGIGAGWYAMSHWPEPRVMPVVGATSRDWHPETFWYEPWGASQVHKGMDIFAARGTPVVATTNHIILSLNDTRRGGKNIWALGPNWRFHYYAHLDTIADDLGWYVKAGTPLGTVGSTGNAQGKPAHLHYGIRNMSPDESLIGDSTLGEQKAYWLNPIVYLESVIVP